MEFHPFAEVWPLLTDDKLQKLAADIKANGLLVPIVTYDDMILDGRNRYNACIIAGVTPSYVLSKAKNDREALFLSASYNEQRRHLSDNELAFIAEQIANIKMGQYAKTGSPRFANAKLEGGETLVTLDEAAKALRVSKPKISDARAIVQYAPELKEAVLTGRAAMRSSANIARARGKQKKVVSMEEAKAKRRSKFTVVTGDKPEPLTPKQVDPDWTGTDMAFVAEYGHVYAQTSVQRSKERFSAWTIGMRQAVKAINEQHLPDITPIVLDRLREVRPGEVEKMGVALNELEKQVAIARDLFNRAKGLVGYD